jgi:polygalacturonase
VKILDSQIVDSDNGVRIKTVSNAKGSVKNVTYKGITLKNVSIVIPFPKITSGY